MALLTDYFIFYTSGRKCNIQVYIIIELIISCLQMYFSNVRFIWLFYCIVINGITFYVSKEDFLWKKKRVYCCGVFDMMHEGHMELFKKLMIIFSFSCINVMSFAEDKKYTESELAEEVEKRVTEKLKKVQISNLSKYSKDLLDKENALQKRERVLACSY